MKKLAYIIVAFIFSVIISCGGGGSSTSVTVTLSPVNGATYKLLGTAVTATFSAAITAPADWSTIFTLKKNNTGDNLCTSVTLSADALTATCLHDELDFASSYTVALTGLSGVTEPTPVLFQTSNMFGGFKTEDGNYLRIAIDEPSIGMLTLWPEGSDTPFESAYTVSSSDPTLYTMTDLDNTEARIAGSFITFPKSNDDLFIGLLIDPNQTDMNFTLGKTYGGLGLATYAPGYGVTYCTEAIDAAGSAGIRSNTDISAVPGSPFDFLLSSYTFETADYDFLLTQDPIELSTYVNADGYSITSVDHNGSYANLLIGNEDRADGTIPAEIAVDDVYKGYIYTVPVATNTLDLRVAAIEGSSISIGVSFAGNPENVFSFSNVTDPAGWGTGFYKNVHDNKTIVIRILNQNAILFTYSDSDPEHSDYNLALVIK